MRHYSKCPRLVPLAKWVQEIVHWEKDQSALKPSFKHHLVHHASTVQNTIGDLRSTISEDNTAKETPLHVVFEKVLALFAVIHPYYKAVV